MTSLEKSLADQMKQHQSELDVIRKDKGEVTKELQQSKQDYEKVQLSCKEFEMKHEVAQESIANLKKDLKSKVRRIFKVFRIGYNSNPFHSLYQTYVFYS